LENKMSDEKAEPLLGACCECGASVELNGTTPDDAWADEACAECGRPFCEGCAEDAETFVYGDPDDPGGPDEQKVCSKCANKIHNKNNGR